MRTTAGFAHPPITTGKPHAKRRSLRFHHHRQRGRWRHARPQACSFRQAHSHPRTRRLSAARKAELGSDRSLREEPLRVEGRVVRLGRQAIPAGSPLLRRRRDQDVRRRDVSVAPAGFHCSSHCRRLDARLADPVRGARTVLHAGGKALPRPRPARRRPHRSTGQRTLCVSAREPRAAHSGDRRWLETRGLSAGVRADGHHARRGGPSPQPVHTLQFLRRLSLPRPRQGGR